MVPGYKPVKVTASAAKGAAEALGCAAGTEDTITLLVEWRGRGEDEKKLATGVYTASWTAPLKAGVHSNQYFHCMFFCLSSWLWCGVCALLLMGLLMSGSYGLERRSQD